MADGARTHFEGKVVIIVRTRQILVSRALVLTAVMLLAVVITLPLGWFISNNPSGLMAGLCAAGVCLLAAFLALGVRERFRSPEHILAFVLVGMAIRMGIPLGSALVILFWGRPLADAGFFYYLIVFYPVMLAAETALALPGVRMDDSRSTPSQGDSG